MYHYMKWCDDNYHQMWILYKTQRIILFFCKANAVIEIVCTFHGFLNNVERRRRYQENENALTAFRWKWKEGGGSRTATKDFSMQCQAFSLLRIEWWLYKGTSLL